MLRSAHPLVPLLTTLLFIFHPVHTEVVANNKSRDELLAFLFAVLCFYLLFLFLKNRKTSFLIFSLLSFFCSLLSKDNAFAFVAVIPLLLYFFSDQPLKIIIKISAVFFFLGGINILIRFLVLDSLTISNINFRDNVLMTATNKMDQLATVFFILGKSTRLLFFPLKLSYDYSYNEIPVISWNNQWAIISLLLYAGMIVFALLKLKEKNIFAFCILFS